MKMGYEAIPRGSPWRKVYAGGMVTGWILMIILITVSTNSICEIYCGEKNRQFQGIVTKKTVGRSPHLEFVKDDSREWVTVTDSIFILAQVGDLIRKDAGSLSIHIESQSKQQSFDIPFLDVMYPQCAGECEDQP